jgi:hypothetical protein
MAIFEADKAVLLAKIEGTYNQDPGPAAANLIVAHDIKVDPTGVELKRDALLSVEGKLPSEMYEGPVKITFKTHLFAVAAPGSAIVLGPLFKGVSMAETLGSGYSRYTLALASDGNTASLTFYFYHGGRLYKATGCCGGLKVDAKVGELFEMEWEFSGNWALAGISDTAFPSLSGMPTLGAPLRFAGAVFTFDGAALKIANCKIDFGQKVVGRKDPAAVNGIGRWWVESIEPKASLDPQADALETYNPWQKAVEKDLGTLIMRVTAGSVIHKFQVTNMQPSWPKPGERDGLQAYAIDATARASAEDVGYSALFEATAI